MQQPTRVVLRVIDLPVAAPCQQSWDQMQGGDDRRQCAVCQEPVVDLSALTRRQAGQVLRRAAGGSLCVRYAYAEDGAILFQQERPAPLARRARELALAAGLAVAAAGTPALAQDAPAMDVAAASEAGPGQRPAPLADKPPAQDKRPQPPPAQDKPPVRPPEERRPPKLMGKIAPSRDIR